MTWILHTNDNKWPDSRHTSPAGAVFLGGKQTEAVEDVWVPTALCLLGHDQWSQMSYSRKQTLILSLWTFKDVFFKERGFPGDSYGRESACNARNLGSIPGSGRSPREENAYLLQYSYLEPGKAYLSLPGYCPWGHKELDATEWLTLAFTLLKKHQTILWSMWWSEYNASFQHGRTLALAPPLV